MDRAIGSTRAWIVFGMIVVATVFVLGILRVAVAFGPGLLTLKELYGTIQPWIAIAGCAAATTLFVGVALTHLRIRRAGDDIGAIAALRSDASLLTSYAICAFILSPVLSMT